MGIFSRVGLFSEIMVLVTMPGTAVRIRAPNSLIL